MAKGEREDRLIIETCFDPQDYCDWDSRDLGTPCTPCFFWCPCGLGPWPMGHTSQLFVLHTLVNGKKQLVLDIEGVGDASLHRKARQKLGEGSQFKGFVCLPNMRTFNVLLVTLRMLPVALPRLLLPPRSSLKNLLSLAAPPRACAPFLRPIRPRASALTFSPTPSSWLRELPSRI